MTAVSFPESVSLIRSGPARLIKRYDGDEIVLDRHGQPLIVLDKNGIPIPAKFVAEVKGLMEEVREMTESRLHLDKIKVSINARNIPPDKLLEESRIIRRDYFVLETMKQARLATQKKFAIKREQEARDLKAVQDLEQKTSEELPLEDQIKLESQSQSQSISDDSTEAGSDTSYSPVKDKQLEYDGAIFDKNIQSMEHINLQEENLIKKVLDFNEQQMVSIDDIVISIEEEGMTNTPSLSRPPKTKGGIPSKSGVSVEFEGTIEETVGEMVSSKAKSTTVRWLESLKRPEIAAVFLATLVVAGGYFLSRSGKNDQAKLQAKQLQAELKAIGKVSPEEILREECWKLSQSASKAEGIGQDMFSVSSWEETLRDFEVVYFQAYEEATNDEVLNLSRPVTQNWGRSPVRLPSIPHISYTTTKKERDIMTAAYNTELDRWKTDELTRPIHLQFNLVGQHYNTLHQNALIAMITSRSRPPSLSGSARFSVVYRAFRKRMEIPPICAPHINEPQSTIKRYKLLRQQHAYRRLRMRVALNLNFGARSILPPTPPLPALHLL